jgi:hypothetical protein
MKNEANFGLSYAVYLYILGNFAFLVKKWKRIKGILILQTKLNEKDSETCKHFVSQINY